ncbi:MAG: LysE family translocator [Alphaproteobacteria bacterium]|nr:LysE family translocator [Alphaproteobacteria bacterium]TAD90226.1 MAG: LysE family translocator [Alphaproteobacteria bacterium]
MSFDVWFAFAVYVVVASVTPGPNNTMLLASGVNHGITRSWPHLLGVNIGFNILLAAVGLGLGGVFTQLPWLHGVLKVGGAAYLLWLAWKIARSGPPSADGEPEPPITFLQAALFQWINPKAWVMTLGTVATYVPPDSYWSALAIALPTFTVLGLPCGLVWVIAGSALSRLLRRPALLRAVNIVMALALAASVAVVVI